MAALSRVPQDADLRRQPETARFDRDRPLCAGAVFDATPPTAYSPPAANSDPATYDFMGRMTARLTRRVNRATWL